MNTIEIVPYQSAYAQDFYDMNIEWLETFFYVEPHDEEVLGNPETYIINPGGHIFFARKKAKNVGVVALIPMEAQIFELSKMAVLPEMRGQAIGQQLMQHCLDFAKEQAWKKLIIYSNTKLENAIHIYKKYGFVEIPIEKGNPYERGNIKMEYCVPQ